MKFHPAAIRAGKRAHPESEFFSQLLAKMIHYAIDDHLENEMGDAIFMRRRELCSNCSGKASGVTCGDCTTGFMNTYHADHLKSEGWEELREAAETGDSLRIDRALRRVRREKP